jgi:dihydrodipicolinate synthase/N-acetylneuraminate lyase
LSGLRLKSVAARFAGTGFQLSARYFSRSTSYHLGADGILALPLYYPNADEVALTVYYAAIGSATPLGLFVYTRDWVNPGPTFVERLAARVR